MNRLMIALLLAAIAGVSGCNTISGAGEDIQQGGKAVSDTAKDVQRDM